MLFWFSGVVERDQRYGIGKRNTEKNSLERSAIDSKQKPPRRYY